MSRSNNRTLYDNGYIIEQLKQQKLNRDYWFYNGYGENENKCNRDFTCKISKSDLVDTESDLFNLGRQIYKYSGDRLPTEPIKFETDQPPYCNPYIYPPNRKKIE